jgi:hypothetical protein
LRLLGIFHVRELRVARSPVANRQAADSGGAHVTARRTGRVVTDLPDLAVFPRQKFVGSLTGSALR